MYLLSRCYLVYRYFGFGYFFVYFSLKFGYLLVNLSGNTVSERKLVSCRQIDPLIFKNLGWRNLAKKKRTRMAAKTTKVK